MGNEPRKRTSGIDRTLQVLDTLTDRQAPLSAYDIAKSTGAPLSTVYRLVDELVDRDMLTRVDDGLDLAGAAADALRADLSGQARHVRLRPSGRCSACPGRRVKRCRSARATSDSMVVIAMAETGGHLARDFGCRFARAAQLDRLRPAPAWPSRRRGADQATFAEFARPSPTGLAETDPVNGWRNSRVRDYLDRLVHSSQQCRIFGGMHRGADPRCPRVSCMATISIVLSEGQAREKQDCACRGGAECRLVDRARPLVSRTRAKRLAPH